MNFVHSILEAVSGDDSFHDSGIENIYRLILNEANEVVNDCIHLGLVFRESDEFVANRVCDIIRED